MFAHLVVCCHEEVLCDSMNSHLCCQCLTSNPVDAAAVRHDLVLDVVDVCKVAKLLDGACACYMTVATPRSAKRKHKVCFHAETRRTDMFALYTGVNQNLDGCLLRNRAVLGGGFPRIGKSCACLHSVC